MHFETFEMFIWLCCIERDGNKVNRWACSFCCNVCWARITKLQMFSVATRPDLRMQLYKSRLEKGKSHHRLGKAPLQIRFPQLSISQARHGGHHRTKPRCNNRTTQPSTVWALWRAHPVMVCLGEARRWPQPPTPHRLNHCLLRQEGCPLYDIICCPCSVSHLWLWQNEVCVFPRRPSF